MADTVSLGLTAAEIISRLAIIINNYNTIHDENIVARLYEGETINGRQDSSLSSLQGQINAIQNDIGANGLGKRMDDAETNLGQIHEQDTRQDEQITDIYTKIGNLSAAISMIGPGSGGGTGLSIQAMTQEAYDELETYDANTLYIII